jgi:hypothetical protein
MSNDLLFQLIRPEFQAFLDNEQSMISLVCDVADTLEEIAANQHHTPALYSVFLKAVIAAKTENSAEGGMSGQGDSANLGSNLSMGPPSSSASANQGMNNEGVVFSDDFHFDSEMGPVADISTFPPTMASNPSDDTLGMLSMDSILSGGFWDSVLVPGKQ